MTAVAKNNSKAPERQMEMMAAFAPRGMAALCTLPALPFYFALP
jgi:hypothetical protein